MKQMSLFSVTRRPLMVALSTAALSTAAFAIATIPTGMLSGMGLSAQAQSRSPQTLVAQAARPQQIQLQLSAQKQVVSKNEQGQTQITWQPINSGNSNVQPGEVIRYVISSQNTSPRPVKNFTLTQPIPKGTVFVPSSVTPTNTPDMTVLYSIDQGKTFVAQPTVQVREANGQLVTRPAPATAYTHVRWQFRQPISPAVTLQNTYQVRVR